MAEVIQKTQALWRFDVELKPVFWCGHRVQHTVTRFRHTPEPVFWDGHRVQHTATRFRYILQHVFGTWLDKGQFLEKRI